MVPRRNGALVPWHHVPALAGHPAIEALAFVIDMAIRLTIRMAILAVVACVLVLDTDALVAVDSSIAMTFPWSS